MSTITAAQYASYYSLASALSGTATKTASPTPVATTSDAAATPAAIVTLSDAAKAALAAEDFATVTADTRTALSKAEADATAKTPGTAAPAIDLSSFDRRAVFAIASNAGNQFTSNEQSLATQELQNRFDQALAGPAAIARVTGDLAGVYKAANTYLDGASDEEKATSAWSNQKAAVTEAAQTLAAQPDDIPDVAGDPVVDYLHRSADGTAGQLRDFSAVAADVRTALDAQYAAARANGKQLVFDPMLKSGQQVDFSSFDTRSLSAIALDQGGQFSTDEVAAAGKAIKSRNTATLMAGLSAAASSSDPTAFAQNLISAYGSMSPEERQAAGWSDSFYNTVVQNYQTASKLASMFGDSGSSEGSSALSLLSAGNTGGGSNGMSLLDYL